MDYARTQRRVSPDILLDKVEDARGLKSSGSSSVGVSSFPCRWGCISIVVSTNEASKSRKKQSFEILSFQCNTSFHQNLIRIVIFFFS
jgi:hypothetical protein